MTLLDPNPTVLAHASRRLAPMKVSTVEADVLKPLPVRGPFDSAALNYVLHCLPGPQPHKAVAIRNVAAVLTPDGVLFGGTVLGRPEQHTPLARASLWAFNRQGVFDNLADTEEGLAGSSRSRFIRSRSKWSAPSHNSRPPARIDRSHQIRAVREHSAAGAIWQIPRHQEPMLLNGRQLLKSSGVRPLCADLGRSINSGLDAPDRRSRMHLG